MVGFGNLEGTEKKITSKLSIALSEGNMGSDKSAAINFSHFISSTSFDTKKHIGENESESEIVEQIQLGKTELFNKIDNYYRGDLLSFANYKMRNFSLRDKHESAKEIVQQTLSNVLKVIMRGKYDHSMPIRAYLFKSTAGNCTLFMRENSVLRLPKFFEDISVNNSFGVYETEGINFDTNSIYSIVDKIESDISEVFNKLDVGEIGEIMRGLKPKFRNVIEMRYFSSSSHKEIAQTLNISVSQSQDRAKYGLLKLKGLLEERILSKD
tara:strand:+ start:659 stop:1462 length:804 start_codon:yes stop_codon:yes gene_type:complete